MLDCVTKWFVGSLIDDSNGGFVFYLLQAPITTPVSSDKFWFLTKGRAISLPSPFNNKGNYVIRFL